MENMKSRTREAGRLHGFQYHPDTQVAMAVLFGWLLLALTAISNSSILPRAAEDTLASCPGYKATNVKTSSSTLTADLSLAGPACNFYGDDLKSLTLQVVYETSRSLRHPHGILEIDIA